MSKITLNRLVFILKNLSIRTAITIIFTFIVVVVCSLLAPLILRYFLLPKTITHQEHLDFLFRTCDDQLSGVCSYPEAVLNLDELNIPLSSGYYYSFILTLDLFDTDNNNKLGVFQTQITAKNNDGKIISNYKKPIILRKNFLNTAYIIIRNLLFFPFYILGFFSSGDQIKTIVLTNQFYEDYNNPTSTLIVQIQNRYIQVVSGTLEIKAVVGLSTYFVNEYPILYFISCFSICFMANFTIFLLYWTYHGIKIYNEEQEKYIKKLKKKPIKKEQEESEIDTDQQFVNLWLQMILPIIPKFIKDIFVKKSIVEIPDEPSPNVWNKDEQPESVSLDEEIPGWGILNNDSKVTENNIDEDIKQTLTNIIDDNVLKENETSPTEIDELMTGIRKRSVNLASPIAD